jgi:23S rRNA (cytidine2498-2'-O)-methyltransferase
MARQLLPDAARVAAASVREWAECVCGAVIGVLPEDRPWRLHVTPHYGVQVAERTSSRVRRGQRQAKGAAPNNAVAGDVARAGWRRCELIRAAAIAELKRRRRRLLRRLFDATTPFTPVDSLVQVLLTSPESGWLSVAVAPQPFALRQTVWPFPKGEVAVAVDPAAPSRAFAKLLEAEQRLGTPIAPGETCVDLGAAPGSWSYVALKREAEVTAVDRALLRDDLMQHPRLRFVRGDAFRFAPERPVDWLLCDVIASPDKSIDLLLHWLQKRWAKRFVVSIKFKGRDDYPKLDRLKAELPALAAEWRLVRLTANKNEACAFGVAAGRQGERGA